MEDNEQIAETLRENGFCAMSVMIGVDAGTFQDPAQPPAFPRQIAQAEEAVAWAKANAATYGGDPNRVMLVGGSAGGHIAVMTAQELNRAHGAGYIRAAVALSGLFNLVTLIPESIAGEFNIEAMAKAVGLTVAQLEAYNAKTLGEPTEKQVRERAERWSPELRINKPTDPPLWISHSAGETIIPVSQVDNFDTALTAAGVSHTLKIVSGGGHGYAYWGTVKAEIFNFLMGA